MPHASPDVVVIGGGVVGLTLAYELARQDARVLLIEKNPRTGQEASWAGAGMLPPGNPDRASTLRDHLRGWSHRLWEEFSANLREESGIDNGFRECGSIRVADFGESLDEELSAWQRERVPIEQPATPSSVERSINPEFAHCYRLPTAAQIRNPDHLRALMTACRRRGVEVCVGEEILAFDQQGTKVIAAKTDTGRTIAAGAFCVSAGAWTQRIFGEARWHPPIKPIRGQIVRLLAESMPISHCIEQGSRYLVPRPGGEILIGSTEEDVGFHKATTAEGIAGLLSFSRQMVPALSRAEVTGTWAGLRPGGVDEPLLGKTPGTENLYIAAGHFRSGLQMSPATGRAMRQLILGEALDFPLPPIAGM